MRHTRPKRHNYHSTHYSASHRQTSDSYKGRADSPLTGSLVSLRRADEVRAAPRAQRTIEDGAGHQARMLQREGNAPSALTTVSPSGASHLVRPFSCPAEPGHRASSHSRRLHHRRQRYAFCANWRARPTPGHRAKRRTPRPCAVAFWHRHASPPEASFSGPIEGDSALARAPAGAGRNLWLSIRPLSTQPGVRRERLLVRRPDL